MKLVSLVFVFLVFSMNAMASDVSEDSYYRQFGREKYSPNGDASAVEAWRASHQRNIKTVAPDPAAAANVEKSQEAKAAEQNAKLNAELKAKQAAWKTTPAQESDEEMRARLIAKQKARQADVDAAFAASKK